jgi:4-hydroxy-2-oxoheptanedioate aldolase
MAIATVLKAAKGAGKYAGYFALGAEEATRRWKQRFDFVNGAESAGIVAVTARMSQEMKRMRGPIGEEASGVNGEA